MRRIWAVRVLAVVAVLGLTIVSTSADQGRHVSLKAKLSGFNESPPKLSNGTGSFTGTINGSTLSYTLTYSGMASDVTQAHIHFGQLGVSAAIFLWLCDSATNPSPTSSTPHCPAKGGTVKGSLSAADVQGVAAQGIAKGDFAGALRIIRSGDAYANVHTVTFGAGEIRGQVSSED
jgi:hypothetical protein